MSGVRSHQKKGEKVTTNSSRPMQFLVVTPHILACLFYEYMIHLSLFEIHLNGDIIITLNRTGNF